MILTPGEIHKIANRLSRLKRNYRRNGIHWESVLVTIEDGGQVYLEWKEDQGGPYLQRVPCSEFILNLADESTELDNEANP